MRRITAHPADSENFPIRDQIKELLPAVAEWIAPPSEEAWGVLGVEEGALAEFALGALSRRLALIGVPLNG